MILSDIVRPKTKETFEGEEGRREGEKEGGGRSREEEGEKGGGREGGKEEGGGCNAASTPTA